MSVRRLAIHSVSFFLMLQIVTAGASAYDSATNGAYGGYVEAINGFRA